MDTLKTKREIAWQPKVASLMIPVLITVLVPILFFNSLTIYQFVGSGVMLTLIFLSLMVGKLKDLPNKDITILWVGSLLFNAYLLSYVF